MTACTGSSAGLIVRSNGQILLGERIHGSPGYAPPAGHVDPGELPRMAAERELGEEMSIRCRSIEQVYARRQVPDLCSRGTPAHDWWVGEGFISGDPIPNPNEVRGFVWATRADLADLARLTIGQLAGGATVEERRKNPGLEPVWITLLIGAGRL